MLVFRYGKIVSFIPRFEISIGRSTFYNGIEAHITLWSRGFSITVTTKKIYTEYKEKEKQMLFERMRQMNDKARPKT